MASPSRTWAFTSVELLLVAVMASVASLAGWVTLVPPGSAPLHAEAALLKDMFGPERYSRHEEEWIIRDFFQDRRDGYFVDVGANHYQVENNTFYLESRLGWGGIAIDPLTEFEAEYLVHRPRTKFMSYFISNVSDAEASVFVLGTDSLVTSADRDFTERHGTNATEVRVPTITLDDLLDREGVEAIDFLNMDIELWEPKALAGFDVERFQPKLVCIEAHPEVRQDILDYFAFHGYTVLGKYLRVDVHNLYFAPMR